MGIHPYPQSALGMVGQIRIVVNGRSITSPQHVITQEQIDTPIDQHSAQILAAYRILPPKGMQIIQQIMVDLPTMVGA